MDWFYDRTLVKPYTWLANVNRADFIDLIYHGVAAATISANKRIVQTQTGQLRTYAGVMVLGLVLIIAITLGVNAT
jgi:NADH:ubiquinone oxidoreductase subunit 5 (subunit L)/multisubunit Na+/H+ antiporter MnhA subunit